MAKKLVCFFVMLAAVVSILFLVHTRVDSPMIDQENSLTSESMDTEMHLGV